MKLFKPRAGSHLLICTAGLNTGTGFIYLKCHDLLTHCMIKRLLGYLQFGTNPGNAALNILVRALHMLGLCPRVEFLWDIFLSACYSPELGKARHWDKIMQKPSPCLHVCWGHM